MILLLAAFLIPVALRAQSPKALQLAALVDAHYNHITTLREQFTERFTGLNLDRTESGQLTLKKPGRMRWYYDSPTGKTFVMDGKYAWFFSPGDAEAQRVPASKLDDMRSPIRYLLGHAHLEKELTQLAIAAAPNGYRLTGIPRQGAANVRLITLTVTATGELISLRIEQTDGTVTEFSFSKMQENIPLKDSIFLFTPPDGIPVVDSMPPI